MKIIATILFIVFGLVQLAPAVASLICPTTSVFIVDEEKGEDKTETDKKEKKKDYTTYAGSVDQYSLQSNIALHLSEKITTAPCLEKLSPPPNFS